MGPVVSTCFRVRYGETDQMGVVFNAHYLSWFEMGRTEYCRALSRPYTLWEKEGLFLPVVEASIRYKNPLRYDDRVRLKTSIREVAPCSITFVYKVIREEDSRVAAEGSTKHAFCDRSGKLVRKPEPFYRWLLEQLEQRKEEVVPRERKTDFARE
jgi:acyl-CoA thioester hydrolase